MRILMLDDRVPHPWLGAGYPRAKQVIEQLCELGHKVWLLPCITNETQKEANQTLPARCRYIPQSSEQAIAHHVEQNAHRYDAIWVSRPHNMAMLQRYLPERHAVWQSYSRVIYDAEAIFALRSERMRQYYPDAAGGRSLAAELGMADTASAVVVVNHLEDQYFRRRGHTTHTLAAVFSPRACDVPFSERNDFLFVGALRNHPEPNSDAILWFCQEVMPRINEHLTVAASLSIVGDISPALQNQLKGPHVQVLGRMDDLSSIYAEHRVFIAPHRFAAGIPHKVLEASEFGLPCVTSQLLADQLDWRDGMETAVAATGDAEEFAHKCVKLYCNESTWTRIQSNAVGAIETQFSMDAFRSALEAALGAA